MNKFVNHFVNIFKTNTIRPDMGFRIVCEQVSHHPPVSAFFGEGVHFTLHGSIQPKMKFWGKSIEVTPKGNITLYLKK